MAAHTVRELMTDNVQAVAPQTPLDQVYDLMFDTSCRHVPVVENDAELVGVLSERDLLRLTGAFASGSPQDVQDALRQTLAEQVMVRGVMTVGPDDDVNAAAELLLDNKIGCLPVVEGRRLVGIVTEADFVKFLSGAGAEEPAEDEEDPESPTRDRVPWT